MRRAENGTFDPVLDLVRGASEANNIGWPEHESADEAQLCALIRGAGVNGVVSRAEFEALLPPGYAPSEQVAFARSLLLSLDVFVAEANPPPRNRP